MNLNEPMKNGTYSLTEIIGVRNPVDNTFTSDPVLLLEQIMSCDS